MNVHLERFTEINKSVITDIFMITTGMGEKMAYIFMSDRCNQESIPLLADSECDWDNSIEPILVQPWHGDADELRKAVGTHVTI